MIVRSSRAKVGHCQAPSNKTPRPIDRGVLPFYRYRWVGPIGRLGITVWRPLRATTRTPSHFRPWSLRFRVRARPARLLLRLGRGAARVRPWVQARESREDRFRSRAARGAEGPIAHDERVRLPQGLTRGPAQPPLPESRLGIVAQHRALPQVTRRLDPPPERRPRRVTMLEPGCH